jgi:hypothetical protein
MPNVQQPRTQANISPVIVVGTPVAGTGVPVDNLAQGVPVGNRGAERLGGALEDALADIEMGGGYTHEELIVLNYRSTVKCFAVLDGISIAMNLSVAYGTVEQNDKFGVYIIGLLLLLGPVMGYSGADTFDRSKVLVYVVFCCVKLLGQILAALATADIIVTLIALLGLWITKIVVSFYQALAVIPAHRKQALRQANIPVHYVYS